MTFIKTICENILFHVKNITNIVTAVLDGAKRIKVDADLQTYDLSSAGR